MGVLLDEGKYCKETNKPSQHLYRVDLQMPPDDIEFESRYTIGYQPFCICRRSSPAIFYQRKNVPAASMVISMVSAADYLHSYVTTTCSQHG
jgi:hypothetical protein